jgi:hemoglobin
MALALLLNRARTCPQSPPLPGTPTASKYLVTEMVCWAAGGPQQYSGRSMEDTHRDLMISEAEWQAFMDDLRRTLDKFEVPRAEQAELEAIVDSTKEVIVVAPP